MRIRSLLLAAVAALGLSSAAQAALVTFNYTGEITSTSDSAYTLGQALNFSVVLDTSAPIFQLQNGGTTAVYNAAVQSITFGATTFTVDGVGVTGQSQIHDNRPVSPGVFSDQAMFAATDWSTAFADITFLFTLNSANPAAVNSLAIPNSPFAPLAFASATAMLTFDNFNGDAGSYVAQINAVSAVPEPATWALMILGFAAMGFVGYRRSRKLAAAAA